MAEPAPDAVDAASHAQRVAETCRRLGPRLPDVDPDALFLIVESLLRPPSVGRPLFIRAIRPGVFAP